jgi:hypothetical protein
MITPPSQIEFIDSDSNFKYAVRSAAASSAHPKARRARMLEYNSAGKENLAPLKVLLLPSLLFIEKKLTHRHKTSH